MKCSALSGPIDWISHVHTFIFPFSVMQHGLRFCLQLALYILCVANVLIETWNNLCGVLDSHLVRELL